MPTCQGRASLGSTARRYAYPPAVAKISSRKKTKVRFDKSMIMPYNYTRYGKNCQFLHRLGNKQLSSASSFCQSVSLVWFGAPFVAGFARGNRGVGLREIG